MSSLAWLGGQARTPQAFQPKSTLQSTATSKTLSSTRLAATMSLSAQAEERARRGDHDADKMAVIQRSITQQRTSEWFAKQEMQQSTLAKRNESKRTEEILNDANEELKSRRREKMKRRLMDDAQKQKEELALMGMAIVKHD